MFGNKGMFKIRDSHQRKIVNLITAGNAKRNLVGFEGNSVKPFKRIVFVHIIGGFMQMKKTA